MKMSRAVFWKMPFARAARVTWGGVGEDRRCGLWPSLGVVCWFGKEMYFEGGSAAVLLDGCAGGDTTAPLKLFRGSKQPVASAAAASFSFCALAAAAWSKKCWLPG